jgi:hypothetical protein
MGRRLYVAIMMFITAFMTSLGFASPVQAACADPYVFAVPAWYRGLQAEDCSIKAPDQSKPDGVRNFIIKISLNIIQALLVISAYITIFFIIKGGFNYMISAGSSDGMANARKTITNAVIGLVIAALSASIVNAVAGVI